MKLTTFKQRTQYVQHGPNKTRKRPIDQGKVRQNDLPQL